MSEFMEKLAELVKKDPGSLTEHDLAFLQARRSYLSPEHIQALGLDEVTDDESATEDKPKRAKKITSEE